MAAKIPASANAALIKKAKSSGISLSTLKKVYKRGQAYLSSGSRPGVSMGAWAMGRSIVLFVVLKNTIQTFVVERKKK